MDFEGAPRVEQAQSGDAAATRNRSEVHLLTLVSTGMTNEEIAKNLATSVAAVKWRASGIFAKLSVRNRIEAVARAGHLLQHAPAEVRGLALGPMPEQLTNSELDILRLLGKGMTRREIAENLSMTPGTVKWYLSEIFGKLQVRNRVEALMRARQLEWL